ncbi:hypothetical protein [Actinomadura luteofluorescens]|uniref:hypothetical protein n=1 Tax=Actinomadura luteofluorescens TaxID=46163 RepID=UPI002164C6FD|nr:hypothetical protein [Actinomadura glauciflava]
MKLIAAAPRVPLRLEYVVGLVRGCGGDAAEQSRWASACRRIRREQREFNRAWSGPLHDLALMH